MVLCRSCFARRAQFSGRRFANSGRHVTQSGRKAEPLLEEALAKRQNLPLVLTILGDLGNLKHEPELRRFSDDPDPLVATAARSALRVLKAQSGIGG
jgi:hypothetical protein